MGFGGFFGRRFGTGLLGVGVEGAGEEGEGGGDLALEGGGLGRRERRGESGCGWGGKRGGEGIEVAAEGGGLFEGGVEGGVLWKRGG